VADAPHPRDRAGHISHELWKDGLALTIIMPITIFGLDGQMRTFTFALAVVVTALAGVRAGAADRLPRFDIARNCSVETAGAVTGGSSSCVKQETEAKNELAKRWSSFAAAKRRDCVGMSSTGGEQSYVELLSCLEMSTGQFSGGEAPKR